VGFLIAFLDCLTERGHRFEAIGATVPHINCPNHEVLVAGPLNPRIYPQLRQESDEGWWEQPRSDNVTVLTATCRSLPVPCPRCAASATAEQRRRPALGYHPFRCRACRRVGNERTGTAYNHPQYPADVVLLVVLWRLRYKRSLCASYASADSWRPPAVDRFTYTKSWPR